MVYNVYINTTEICVPKQPSIPLKFRSLTPVKRSIGLKDTVGWGEVKGHPV